MSFTLTKIVCEKSHKLIDIAGLASQVLLGKAFAANAAWG